MKASDMGKLWLNSKFKVLQSDIWTDYDKFKKLGLENTRRIKL